MGNKTEDKIGSLYWLLFIVLIVWIISGILTFWFLGEWQIRGIFGDMFGSINSLFSGFAFAGIIYTIYLQRKELKLQRLELKETRKELERSANAQEKSEKAMEKQYRTMLRTAELNALNTMIAHYKDEQKKSFALGMQREIDEMKLKKYVKRTEHILGDLIEE